MSLPTSINSKLVNLVDRVRPTTTAGTRSSSTLKNLPARITNRQAVIRDSSGNRLVSQTIIYLKADADVTEGDEFIVDDVQRPIAGLVRARDGAGNIHHIEATLS